MDDSPDNLDFLTLGGFPFARTGRSDRPVRKWNGSVLRIDRNGSGRTGPVLSVGPVSFHAPARTTGEMRGSFECRILQTMVQNNF